MAVQPCAGLCEKVSDSLSQARWWAVVPKNLRGGDPKSGLAAVCVRDAVGWRSGRCAKKGRARRVKPVGVRCPSARPSIAGSLTPPGGEGTCEREVSGRYRFVKEAE